MSESPIELEPSAGLGVRADVRRQMPEPPPVWLGSVADVHLVASTTRGELLDAFYVDVLRFVRLPGQTVVYRAANHDLVFDLLKPPVSRDGNAPTPIIVPSLYVLRAALAEGEVHYDYARGINAGDVYVMCQDPANNWLTIRDARPVG